MDLLNCAIKWGDLALFVGVSSQMDWSQVHPFDGAGTLAWAIANYPRNGRTATLFMIEVLAQAGFRLLFSDLCDFLENPDSDEWLGVYTLYEKRPDFLARIEWTRQLAMVSYAGSTSPGRRTGGGLTA